MTESAAPRLLFLVTEDWYFVSHRLTLAKAALARGYRVILIARVGRHAEALRAAGIEVVDLDLQRGRTGVWGALRSVWRLVRLYRRLRPDLVHQVALQPAILGSLAARLTGVRRRVNALGGLGYVFTAPDLQARLLRPGVLLGLRLLLRDSTVIVQNDADRTLLVECAGLPLGDIRLIPGSGVDLYRFAPTPEPPAPPVRIAMVSRMLWDKGVGELVGAARLLQDWGCPAEVVLVGAPDPDNPRSIAPEQLRQWVEAGWVQWWGPREDIPAVWRDSHVAVLPSYREGLPKSLLEAAACARPLVTTNVPGCRDALIPGESGLLVPPRDPGALGEALRRLVEDRGLRQRLGLRARGHMEQAFGTARVNAAILGIYGELLARG